ncbi:MAG: hypothetical protein KBD43_17110 [Saprospiraceae bacterium]|nr:hypothetical protein [Saprospiraceae bacterium]
MSFHLMVINITLVNRSFRMQLIYGLLLLFIGVASIDVYANWQFFDEPIMIY